METRLKKGQTLIIDPNVKMDKKFREWTDKIHKKIRLDTQLKKGQVLIINPNVKIDKNFRKQTDKMY